MILQAIRPLPTQRVWVKTKGCGWKVCLWSEEGEEWGGKTFAKRSTNSVSGGVENQNIPLPVERGEWASFGEVVVAKNCYGCPVLSARVRYGTPVARKWWPTCIWNGPPPSPPTPKVSVLHGDCLTIFKNREIHVRPVGIVLSDLWDLSILLCCRVYVLFCKPDFL